MHTQMWQGGPDGESGGRQVPFPIAQVPQPDKSGQRRASHPTAQLTQPGDMVLAQRVMAGDQDAFSVLVERYSPLLYRFAYHFLGEYDQSCDVVQHVFLQLYISLPHLLSGDQLKPWLLRVTQNSCLDELRKRRRHRVTLFSALEGTNEDEELSPLSTLTDVQPQPEEIAEFNELQHMVFQAIQKLPSRFRRVVLLRYVYQYSFAEIGEELKMPMTTAKTYYYRACARLREALPSPH